MAYAAVVSLKQTIQRLQNSSHVSIVSSTREIIEFAYNEAISLQQVLKRSDDRSSSKRLDFLDGEIRGAVHKIEDLLEFHVSDLFSSSQSESHVPSLDLEEVIRREINSLAETVKKMGEEYIIEVDNPLRGEDDDAAASSNLDFGVKIVGLYDEYLQIKYHLLKPLRPYEWYVFSIVGRRGTGRTLVAKKIFEAHIGENQVFDCGAWVTIGPEYEFKYVLIYILAQIFDELPINLEDDEKFLAALLCTRLRGRRYLIVLDDVCDTQIWDKLKSSFPEQNDGSAILLTTSLFDVAAYARSSNAFVFENHDREDLFWDHIRSVMFGQGSTPAAEFEEAGRKIARNCKGLRISLAKVLVFLWKAKKTPQYWNEVAADQKNPIFTVADEISEINKIEEDLCNLFPDDEVNSSSNTNGVGSSTLIKQDDFLPAFVMRFINAAFSGAIETVMMSLFPKRFLPKMGVISFIGMAGIGKTTFVKKFLEDPQIFLHRFDHCVWVTLGPKYQSNDILVDILAQVYPGIDQMHIKRYAKLAKQLCAQLSNKRCLIVLDDVWSQEPLHYLKKLFPEMKGIALVTTRMAEVACVEESGHNHRMRYLNKEESWFLLRQKLFAEELCPPELEEAGKKIAEKCDGLPLTIVTVANLLSKAEKTAEYWNEVAADRQNSLFMDAYNEISKAVLPSFESLPQHLKASMLYMGVFPLNHEIPTSKLINFWRAEGFFEPHLYQRSVEDFASECLLELLKRSLVMICQQGPNYKLKTCRLHSVFWYVCNSEAVKDKFSSS